MNEKYIQMLLMQDCLHGRQHKIAVPNSTQLMWGEVDLLSVTKAGLVHDFEIKCSKSDYNREIGPNHKYNKQGKHWRLQHPETYANYNPSPVPNYFWFVTYGFEIEPPDYAGWMTVEEWGYTKKLGLIERKKAPMLHRGKWNDSQIVKIARLLSYRLLKVYEKEMK